MWRIDGERERARAWLCSDIKSSITNIVYEEEELRDTAAAISQAAGGAPSAMDARMNGHCQSALQELREARSLLERCLDDAERLETETWEEDELY